MRRIFNHFHPLNKLQRERERYLSTHQVPDNIRVLLEAPLPDLDDDIYSLDYLSLDFETSGFNPKTDSLLSVGYLPLINQQLLLSEAVETLIHTAKNVKAETAVINHIVPEMLEKGEAWNVVLDAMLTEAVGKVLIVHGSIVEKRFLNHYMAKRYKLPPLPLLWVDTLQMEKSLHIYKDNNGTDDFRLGSVRERHHLPEYSAHGALVDSLATGELYLALLKQHFEGADSSVRHMKFDYTRPL
ncbi:3'-5' exonuclease [Psychromonas sp. 14N.309.X.WAT.B.A12]|uniref:3'-5' exonuclease n=1 Tax=unclassified Psychromonas TaxID=2614957 RepID=UPI0025AF255C|nr:3'-5' exonuclease [Psychromonas sp. 14N.309.X.WAT.B.A12]MDN2663488.1 3'-5' exonuclease [Psychromonas sp. 14N.309.X.WAT.B.A12]